MLKLVIVFATCISLVTTKMFATSTLLVRIKIYKLTSTFDLELYEYISKQFNFEHLVENGYFSWNY